MNSPNAAKTTEVPRATTPVVTQARRTHAGAIDGVTILAVIIPWIGGNLTAKSHPFGGPHSSEFVGWMPWPSPTR